MKIWKWALLPAVLAMAAATAGADEGEKPDGERRGQRDPERRAKMIEKFDADGDGKLNEEERAQARKAYQAMRGDQGRRRGPRGESRPDDPARRPHWGRPCDQPYGPPDLGKLFDRFDKNEDGQLSREEFKALAHRMRGRHAHRHGPPHEGKRGGPRPGGPDGPPPGGPHRDQPAEEDAE